MAKKSALGKGLGALLSDAAEEAKPRGTVSSAIPWNSRPAATRMLFCAGSSRSAQSITNLSNLESEMLQLAYLTPSLKAQKHTTSLTVMPSRHSPKASTISSA